MKTLLLVSLGAIVLGMATSKTTDLTDAAAPIASAPNNQATSNNVHYPHLPRGETTPRPAQTGAKVGSPTGGFTGQVGTGYPGYGAGYGGQTQGAYPAQGGYPGGGYPTGGYPGGAYPGGAQGGAYPQYQGGYPGGFQGGYQQQGGYPGGYPAQYPGGGYQGGYGQQPQQKQSNGFEDAITDALKKAGTEFVKNQINTLINGDPAKNQPANAGYPGNSGGYPQGGSQGGYQQGYQGGYQQGQRGQYPGGQGSGNAAQSSDSPIQDALTDSLKKAGQTFVSDAVTKLINGQPSQPSGGAYGGGRY